MKSLLLSVLVAAFTTGCIHIPQEQRRAQAAPLRALPEIVMAATLFRLEKHRWPETKEDLEARFRLWKGAPGYLCEIESMTTAEQSLNSVSYRFLFYGGGTANVRVNLK